MSGNDTHAEPYRFLGPPLLEALSAHSHALLRVVTESDRKLAQAHAALTEDEMRGISMTENRTGAAWFVNREFNLTVDFCVWVLERDGLTVAPFDHHSGGTGEARARGLDADNWRAWLNTVVVEESARPSLLDRVLPPSIWSGEPAVGAVLASLWDQYLPLFNDRPGQRLDSVDSPPLDEARRFWDDLEPYRTRIPPLTLFLVGYAWPVDHLVPPAAAVLGVGDADSTFTARAMRIAEELAQVTR